MDNPVDTFLFGTLTAILGGCVGAWAQAQWQEQQSERKRQLVFIEKQVHEFYAPVIGRYWQARSMERVRTGELDAFKQRLDLKGSIAPEIVTAMHWGTSHGRIVLSYGKNNFERQMQFYSEILSLLHDRGYLAQDVLTSEDRDKFVVLGEFVEWGLSDLSKDGSPAGLAPDMDELDVVFAKLEKAFQRKLKILEAGDPNYWAVADWREKQRPTVSETP